MVITPEEYDKQLAAGYPWSAEASLQHKRKAQGAENEYQARLEGRRIYFLTAGPFVKIGTSVDIRHRMDNLSPGCPYPLRLLASYPGGLEEEARVHQRFSHLRRQGEWFKTSVELLDYALEKNEPEA